jgi:hypothetical protein
MVVQSERIKTSVNVQFQVFERLTVAVTAVCRRCRRESPRSAPLRHEIDR